MTQKLPQIGTVMLRIHIRKVAGFAVYICGNFWVTQYVGYFGTRVIKQSDREKRGTYRQRETERERDAYRQKERQRERHTNREKQ